VDSDTEARLARALSVLLKGRTALVIAHRAVPCAAPTGSWCSTTVDHGRGTHQELMEQRGLYRELYELQLAQDNGAG